MTQNETDYNRKQNMKMLVIVFLFLVLATGAYWQIFQNSRANIVEVENVFADVNGDGLIDVIVDGRVIFNENTVNF